jgi:hypothetical protein
VRVGLNDTASARHSASTEKLEMLSGITIP